jgi:hypothetical protein
MLILLPFRIRVLTEIEPDWYVSVNTIRSYQLTPSTTTFRLLEYGHKYLNKHAGEQMQ